MNDWLGKTMQIGFVENSISDEDMQRNRKAAFAQKFLIEHIRHRYYSNQWYGHRSYHERIINLEIDITNLECKILELRKKANQQ